MNSLPGPSLKTIGDQVNKASTDESIKCVLWYSSQKLFSAGTDLKPLTSVDRVTREFSEWLGIECVQYMVESFLHCKKPVVAVVRGAAVGIGFTPMAFCDFVYVTPNVMFSAPFMGSFQSPEGGSTKMFPQIIGPRLTS
mmetsp:Transcript_33213/g.23943  ORF Transcript_33213/g.23943 Transcript_33213/m.23943 type:complete len:139 (+) Transcript_33213:122-538(+)